MFDMRAVHSVTVELHGGMLTLAAACIAIKVIDALWSRFLGERGGLLRKILIRASEYASPTLLMAAIGGVVGLLLSAYTGYSLVPSEMVATSPIVLNKIMVTVVGTELWSLMIAFNLIFGKDAWNSGKRMWFMIMSGGLGYFFTITGGSIGGTMAGKVSIMEPIWEFLGVDLHASWILTMDIIYVIVAIVNIVGVLLVIYSTRILSAIAMRQRS